MPDEVIKIRTEVDDKATRKLSGIKTALKAAFGVASVTMLANFTMKLTNMASAAEEIENKFKVVFRGVGDATDRIDKMAQKTGYATSTLQKFTSELGDFLIPMGFARDEAFRLSEEITQLSLDLASFNNVANEEVLEAFKSAMSGMSRPLMRFGIDVREAALAQEAFNMGLVDSVKAYGKLDPETKRHTRAQALMSKAIKDSADAIGDLERTQDSYANTQRRMQEELKELGESMGKLLMPALADVIGGIGELATEFTKLIPIKTEMDLAVEAAENNVFQFNVLIRTYERLRETENKTKAETQAYRETIEALNRQYGDYLGNIDLEKDKYDKVKESISDAREQLIEYAKTQALLRIRTELQEKYSEAFEKEVRLNKELSRLEEERVQRSEEFKNNAQSSREFYLKTQQTGLDIARTEQQIAKQKKIQQEAQSEINDFIEEYGNMIDSIVDKEKDAGSGIGSEDETNKTKRNTQEYIDATLKLAKLKQEQRQQDEEDVKRRIELYEQETKAFSKHADEKQQDIDDIIAARDRQKAAEREATALLIDSIRQVSSESKAWFEFYKKVSIAETLVSTYLSAQKIFEAFSKSVYLGPAALPLAIAGAGTAVAAGLARVAAIQQQEYRQFGGDVVAGKPYTVGERGREVFVPDIDGKIIPNSALGKLGQKTVVFNINAVDAKSFRDFLRGGGSRVLEQEVMKGKLF